MKRFLVAALLFTFVTAVGFARAEDKPNPTGTWKWTVSFGGQEREMTLKLKLDGEKLKGAMVREDQETPIQDGKYKDGQVSFSVVRERNGQKMTTKYAGKLSGDAIKGTMELGREGQTRSRDWEAKRVMADPTGTWKWTVSMGGREREVTLKLKLDGDKLTGAQIGRNGTETEIQDAKCKKGELSFTIVRERNGVKTTTKYTGKQTGDTIKGKITSDRDGETQTRDWEAKLEKE